MREKRSLGENQFLYQLKTLEDAFTYVLSWDQNAFVVDPGIAEPVLTLLAEEKLTLVNVLLTHYHNDHTGGVETLKKKTDCHIIGPDDKRIPHLDTSVDEGEELLFGPFSIEVFSTPGHTHHHVIYFFRYLHLLFTGDLLFGGGCGRLLEGTPEEMWHSLEKVMNLPDDTAIYCGHEYTVKNLEFAASIEPNNLAVKKRLEAAKNLIAEGKSTVPSTLEEEKKTNPFLRVTDPELRKLLGFETSNPVTFFEHLRKLKDQF